MEESVIAAGPFGNSRFEVVRSDKLGCYSVMVEVKPVFDRRETWIELARANNFPDAYHTAWSRNRAIKGFLIDPNTGLIDEIEVAVADPRGAIDGAFVPVNIGGNDRLLRNIGSYFNFDRPAPKWYWSQGDELVHVRGAGLIFGIDSKDEYTSSSLKLGEVLQRVTWQEELI